MVEAKHLRRLHAGLTCVWFCAMPVAIYYDWIADIRFISVLSIYALFAAHFAAWQGARAEESTPESE